MPELRDMGDVFYSNGLENKVIEIPRHRTMYIDSLTREDSDFQNERSSIFKMINEMAPEQTKLYAAWILQGKIKTLQDFFYSQR